ncbi:MAG TPA: hypothetical protein VM901_08895 [Bdellovibrionota bacterium]|nr:hypothetical protein [Bdellovibrionota bacterium]
MISDFLIANRFYSRASALRKVFDANFSPAAVAHNNRFVWDYWYFENKYVHFRTPALQYFPAEVIQNFTDHLVHWGQRTLGCNAITAPWLSYYIDGCKQELHGDIPHGPWAYVYSLTLDPKHFSGGDTIMLRESILNYWNHVESFDGLDHHKIFESIRPDFNRLLVFDGRIPHGVSTVQGPRDPKLARVVLHGWFTEPSPYIDGPLKAKAAAKTLNQILQKCSNDFTELEGTSGTLSLRLDVSAAGELQKVVPLISSLKTPHFDTKRVSQLVTKIFRDEARGAKFEKSRSASKITLPLIFSQSE